MLYKLVDKIFSKSEDSEAARIDGQSETERAFNRPQGKARVDHSDENPHFSNMPRQLLRTPITRMKSGAKANAGLSLRLH